MRELIAAAKAVIAEWEQGNDSIHDINRLRAAVEQTESDDEIDRLRHDNAGD